MQEVERDFEVLPVEEVKDAILSLIRNNQIVICVGETGSGKTTKLPQFCLESGLLGSKKMCITQPRRVAAISVAQRVGEEQGGAVGDLVGYVVRFEDCTSSRTRIKYVTDGILVRECLSDPLLNDYQVIMLDEAHERSVQTDILFSLLKAACSKRSDLKVLVTSATLDTRKFSAYFGGCPVMDVAGRTYPVDLYHSKLRQVMTASGPSNNSYVQAAVDVVMSIHNKEEDGHILVFLTGQEEIDRACHLLRVKCQEEPQLKDRPQLIVLPLHASLSTEAQKKVFKKADQLAQSTSSDSSRSARKCIVATNIAETSITIPHIRFVVDSGYVKQKAFDPVRKIEALIVVPVSKVSAQQRAGRAGRTGPGQCYRLYSSECYEAMMEETVPEILRTNLSNIVLYLKVLGINDVLGFDFIEPPSPDQIEEALVQLHMLGAIDSAGLVTAVGRKMSVFPVDPTIARMLIEATTERCHCFSQMAAIASVLSSEGVWEAHPRTHTTDQSQPWRKALSEKIESAHERLRDEHGDFLTYLSVFRHFTESVRHARDKESEEKKWCEDNFIRFRSMRLASRIYDQLFRDAAVAGLSVSHEEDRRKEASRIVHCVAAGLFMNSARKTSPEIYRYLPLSNPWKADQDMLLLHLHGSSSLSPVASDVEYVVYLELHSGGKVYMRHVQAVEASSLREFRSVWEAVHPLTLSGRAAPLPPDASAKRKLLPPASEKLLEAPPKKASNEDTSRHEETVNAARQRYLARKKQS